MKNLLAALIFSTAFLAGCGGGPHPEVPYTDLRAGFLTPPDSMQTSVYWYWISGNITREGVIRDLESMKEAGINRAFIGNIGLPPNEAPQGPVELFTDQWWDIMHAALKRASELDIEIGIFNCPGWSQAGGPWIEPGQAMRYLASASVEVSGPARYSGPLPAGGEGFQDVKVLAFADPAAGARELRLTSPGVSFIPANGSGPGLALKPGSRQVIDFPAPGPMTPRTVTVVPAGQRIDATADLQVFVDDQYQTLAQFTVQRVNPNVEVGFDPYAPVVIALPPVEAERFRLVLSNRGTESRISEVIISEVPYVERYPEKTLAKMFEEPLPLWDQYMWRDQPDGGSTTFAVAPGSVIDITEYFDGGTLHWDVPEGNWKVVRYGMLPTGITNGPAAAEGSGFEIDKMTSRFNRHHFDSFIGAIMERIPPKDRTTFRIVVADSYEKGGQNFTDTFIEDFRQAYGYDPLPFLPVYDGYVVGSRDISDRFLWDLRRMVADKLSYEHIGGLRQTASEHGLTLWLENYGHWGFPGEFLQYGGQSDEVAGEFWSEGSLGDIENRAASSAGHIYGKRKISAESFTCGGWAYSRYPANMKQRGDLFFSEGINNTLLHVYISQPQDTLPPGMNAPFGNEFNRHNTWYPYLDMFTLYLKRVNFMLQQGENVADVAYFIGEDAPKMTGVTDPPLPRGYQFDYINAEVILNGMYVEDGLLRLPHGTTYKVLVLPRQRTMRPAVARRIEQLVRDGATVLGAPPACSPSLEGYPDSDSVVRDIAARMWGTDGENFRNYGKGRVFSDTTLDEVFRATGTDPDCHIDEDVPVLFGHRDCGARQIYFLTNQSGERVKFRASFRTGMGRPELWHPVTGRIRELPDYRTAKGITDLPLELQPYESIFVVFDGKGGRGAAVESRNFPKGEVIARAEGPWTVEFTDKMRGPGEPIVTGELFDWSTHPDPAVKYYSGEALYRTHVDIVKPTDGRLEIDLGDVAAMARVYINGRQVGGVWTPPYRVDITDAVHDGPNEIEVHVVNTWVNRLIGDSRLPENLRTTYSPNNPWNPESPLQRSGLLGPVVVESVIY